MPFMFFNGNADIDTMSKYVFHDALSIEEEQILEGDSANVKWGMYYLYSIFGVKIKLEYNSYDYDDVYNYMLTVKKDVLSSVSADDLTVKDLANIIIRLLSNYLKADIGYEDKGEFRIYSPNIDPFQ